MNKHYIFYILFISLTGGQDKKYIGFDLILFGKNINFKFKITISKVFKIILMGIVFSPRPRNLLQVITIYKSFNSYQNLHTYQTKHTKFTPTSYC